MVLKVVVVHLQTADICDLQDHLRMSSICEVLGRALADRDSKEEHLPSDGDVQSSSLFHWCRHFGTGSFFSVPPLCE